MDFREILLEEHIRLRCSGALDGQSIRFLVEENERDPNYNSACWAINSKGVEVIRVGKASAAGSPEKYVSGVKSVFRHECAHSRFTNRLTRGRPTKEVFNELRALAPHSERLFNLFEDARVEHLWRKEFNESFNWKENTSQIPTFNIEAPEDIFFLRMFSETEEEFHKNETKASVKISQEDYDYALSAYDKATKVNFFHEMTDLIKEWFARYNRQGQQQMEVPQMEISSSDCKEGEGSPSGQSGGSSDSQPPQDSDKDSQGENDSKPQDSKPQDSQQSQDSDKDDSEGKGLLAQLAQLFEDAKEGETPSIPEKREYQPKPPTYNFDVTMIQAIESSEKADTDAGKSLFNTCKGNTPSEEPLFADVEGEKGFFQDARPISETKKAEMREAAMRLKKFLKGGTHKEITGNPKKRFSVRRVLRKDPRCFVNKVEDDGISSRIILFIDCSGSMEGVPIQNAKYLLHVFNYLAMDLSFKVKVILSRSGGYEGRMSCLYASVELPTREETLACFGETGNTEALYQNMIRFEKEMIEADYVMVYTDGDLADRRIDKESLHKKGIYTMGLLVTENKNPEELHGWFDSVVVRSSIKELLDSVAIMLKKGLFLRRI